MLIFWHDLKIVVNRFPKNCLDPSILLLDMLISFIFQGLGHIYAEACILTLEMYTHKANEGKFAL